MARYRKLYAALIGVSVLVALRYFDIEIMGLDAVVLDLITAALTAVGVYGVPNES